MKQDFLSGSKICEKMGLTLDELATRCHRNELTAYRNEDFSPILDSSQCKSKFCFSGNSLFYITLPKEHILLGISKDTYNDFNIKLKNDHNKNHIAQNYPDEYKRKWEFIEIIKDNKKREIDILKHTKKKTVKCDNVDYIMFYRKSSPSIFEKTDPTGKYVCVTDEILFEPKMDGVFHIDLLVLCCKQVDSESSEEILSRQSIKISVEKICDSLEEKLVVSDYDPNYIYIISNEYGCAICNTTHRSKSCCKKYDNEKDYEMCRSKKQQYAVDFFDRGDDRYERPLLLGKEVFVFDKNEFKSQFRDLDIIDNVEEEYYNYLRNFIYELGKINIDYDLFILIDKDPRNFMIHICTLLLDKYRNSEKNEDYAKIVEMYKYVLEHKKSVHWVDLFKKFYPSKVQNGENAFISKELLKFKEIAQENNIPFITADNLRKITPENQSQISEDMKSQIRDMRAKGKIPFKMLASKWLAEQVVIN